MADAGDADGGGEVGLLCLKRQGMNLSDIAAFLWRAIVIILIVAFAVWTFVDRAKRYSPKKLEGYTPTLDLTGESNDRTDEVKTGPEFSVEVWKEDVRELPSGETQTVRRGRRYGFRVGRAN